MVLQSGTNTVIQALLAKHTVADIAVSRKGVIELPSTATPVEGFELLLKHNVLSCPVYDESTKSYIGFLDMRDLVSSIVFAHEEQSLANTFNDRWAELMLIGMQRFGTAVTVTYLSRRNPFRPILATATLLQVARALSTHLHRVPVVDADTGKCVSIISQSSLVHFLQSHREDTKSELSQSIASLGLGLCRVISVASDVSAWQAFKTLEVNSVSGIAIVDRDGRLVANTSARDLKHFVKNKGNLSLDAPIQDYLSRIRQRDFIDEVHPSCSVSITTSISHCIGLLAATGYHRVFIVDGQGRPTGVVSVTDILRFASAEPVGTASASPSNPSTPRGGRRAVEAGTGTGTSATTSASATGTTVASGPGAASPKSHSPAGSAHLRSHSQSSTPIVTPVPSA